MRRVDLTLAVNYVPACVCLCKAIALMLVISLIQPGDEVRSGYIPLAAMLYLDRLVMRNMIFDGNAILLALYFANVHAAVRTTSQRQAYAVLMAGLHLCWAGLCLTLLVDPSRVRWAWEKRAQASKLVPVLLMLVILVATAHVHAPLESGGVRACRALAFTLLCFVWIYLVGIHSPNGIEYLKETNCQFVARLAPVLYSPLWLASAFVPAALAALACNNARHSQPMMDGDVQVTVVPGTPSEPESSPPSPEDAQLHELFRLAKGRLEGIPE